MSNFEKRFMQKGNIPANTVGPNTDMHTTSPVNSTPKFTPIHPSYQKSRITKSKRFNSTNARYKNVVNKMEKDNVSLRQLRKWSQGESPS